ncbi:MAG: type VI secretion system needle protein Hcp [Dysgonamonadaceae bacterium]|jgi:hypothetical protein|nr:type VI secretion system needle protein Hcp [Dysgonamonadaceae bacterium]
MALNLSSWSNLFTQIDTHVEATFVLDGKEYDIEHFGINFAQEVDHKGQPQNEMKGGQISITLTQSIGDNIYDWAKRANKQKPGKILFKSKTAGTVLEIAFLNASCVSLQHKINAMTGTETSLTIAPEKVTLNGITHDNRWRE